MNGTEEPDFSGDEFSAMTADIAPEITGDALTARAKEVMDSLAESLIAIGQSAGKVYKASKKAGLPDELAKLLASKAITSAIYGEI